MKPSTLERKGLTEDMVGVISNLVAAIPWPDRRLGMAEVTTKLLDGKARVAEDVFGWARATIVLGMNELRTGIKCLNDLSMKRKPKTENKHPEMLVDIQAIMSSESQAQPSLRTALLYTNKTAASVRSALVEKGWPEDTLPTIRTISNILNRQEYRLRRVEKSQVQKKRMDRSDFRECARGER